MATDLHDGVQLSFPLFVVRAFVKAAAVLKAGGEWTAEDDAELAAAVKWVDARPMYRDNIDVG